MIATRLLPIMASSAPGMDALQLGYRQRDLEGRVPLDSKVHSMRWFCLSVVLCATHAIGQDVSQGKPGDERTPEFLEQYRAKAVERWEKEIKKLEARDASEEDPVDALLFIGSSSIRRWASIATDMAPYRTIQRGYGGARYSDLAVFAKRILHPHQYRAMLVFVGNDVSGKPEDHSPEQVEELVRYLVSLSRDHQPDAPVLIIEVTPTEKRFAVWPQIREVNAKLREIALTTANTYFIAIAAHYLDPEGNPRSELFVDDKLHLNSDGYDLWSTLIRRRLDEVFRMKEEFDARSSTEATPTAN